MGGAVTQARSRYIVDGARRENVDGPGLVEHDEIERITDADDLRDLILERVGDVGRPA